MEALMTAKRSGSDFEGRFFDLLMDRLDKQDKKLDEIQQELSETHAQTRYTNGRVTALEGNTKILDKAVQKLEKRKGSRFSIEPKTAYLIALFAVIVAVIIATLLKVDVGGIL